MKFALLTGCAVVALSFCLAIAPAEAAKKKGATAKNTQRTAVVQRPRAQRVSQRPATRITVRPRSFLDPGTEVLPGERKYNEYVFPLGYSPTSVIDNTVFSHRPPLYGPLDLPQRSYPF